MTAGFLKAFIDLVLFSGNYSDPRYSAEILFSTLQNCKFE